MEDVEKPTLTYFHAGGRAEAARLFLEVAGVDYRYHSVAYMGCPGEPWEEYKVKHADKLTFGQLPRYQEPGGVDIVQAGAINRYIATKYGLDGSNDMERLAMDVLYEGTVDLLTEIAKAQWAEDAISKQAETTKLLTQTAPKHLAHFEKVLLKNNNGAGYLVGEKLSYVDLRLYLALRRILEFVGGDAVIAKFQSLDEFYKRIDANERIKRFYASDPYKY